MDCAWMKTKKFVECWQNDSKKFDFLWSKWNEIKINNERLER